MTEGAIIFLTLATLVTNCSIYKLMRRMEQMELRYMEKLLNSTEQKK